MKKSILIALLLSLVFLTNGITDLSRGDSLPSNASSSVEVTLLGPKQYTRTEGMPNIYTDTFPGRAGQGKITVRNGGVDGTLAISSAIIKINGIQIFGTSDFNQNVQLLEKTVGLQYENSISIELRSKPGSYLTIKIIQKIYAAGAAVVGPEGGTLSVNDLLLEIPAGALSVSTLLSIESSPELPPNIFDGQPVLGYSKRLLPDGCIFNKPINAIWHYENLLNQIEDPRRLGIVEWSSNSADVITVKHLENSYSMKFQLIHFSFISPNYNSTEGWSTFKLRWDIPIISWHLDKSTLNRSFGGSFLTISRIQEALRKWDSQADSFEFLWTDDKSSANIVFEEAGDITFLNSLLCVFGFNDTTGITCFDNSSVLYGYNMKSGDDITIRIASDAILDEEHASKVLIHEIGHALGLAHPWKDVATAPFPVMKQGILPPKLHNWDLAALDYHYVLSGEVFDDTGDSIPSGYISPTPDLTRAKITSTNYAIIIEARFDEGTFSQDKTAVQFSLDMDQNPSTGHPGVYGGGIVDKEIIGSEFCVNICGDRWMERAHIYKYAGVVNQFDDISSVPVTFSSDGIKAIIPLSTLGGDDGNLNYKVTCASSIFPGGGFTSVQDVMPDISLAAGRVEHRSDFSGQYSGESIIPNRTNIYGGHGEEGFDFSEQEIIPIGSNWTDYPAQLEKIDLGHSDGGISASPYLDSAGNLAWGQIIDMGIIEIGSVLVAPSGTYGSGPFNIEAGINHVFCLRTKNGHYAKIKFLETYGTSNNPKGRVPRACPWVNEQAAI